MSSNIEALGEVQVVIYNGDTVTVLNDKLPHRKEVRFFINRTLDENITTIENYSMSFRVLQRDNGNWTIIKQTSYGLNTSLPFILTPLGVREPNSNFYESVSIVKQEFERFLGGSKTMSAVLGHLWQEVYRKDRTEKDKTKVKDKLTAFNSVLSSHHIDRTKKSSHLETSPGEPRLYKGPEEIVN